MGNSNLIRHSATLLRFLAIVALAYGCDFCQADSGKVAIATNVTEIIIDGDLSDWPKDCPRFPIACPSFGDAPESKEDLTAWFHVGFDKSGARLLVAIEVRDDELIDSSLPFADSWSSQDKAGIYLQPLHGRGGRPVDESLGLTIDKRMVSTDWEGCSKRSNDRICYEWSIDLRHAMPGPDQPFTIAMSVEAIDRDQDSITVNYWSPEGWKQTDASRSGDVIVNVLPSQLGKVRGSLTHKAAAIRNPFGPTKIRFASMTSDRLVVEKMTNSEGSFQVDLPAGKYEVTVADWHEPAQQLRINVVPQQVEECNLVVATQGVQHICSSTSQPLVGHLIPEQQNGLEDQAFGARSFTVQNGLPSGPKNDLLVTPDGAIWIANERNLLKIFGGEILRFDIAPEILGEELRCLHFDGKILWIGTARGLAQFNPNTNELTVPYELRGKFVYRIRPIHDGRLGIATKRGLFVYDQRSDCFQCYGEASGLLDQTCFSLAADRTRGFTWVGTESGLAKFDGERITETISKMDGLPDARIWEITVDSRDCVWFGANRSIFTWDGSSFASVRTWEGETYRHSSSIREALNGHVWCRTFLSSGRTGIAIYEHAADKNTLIHEVPEVVSNLTIDRFRNVWLLSDNGIKQIQTDRVKVNGSPCRVVCADPKNDRVWYSSIESDQHHLRSVRSSNPKVIETSIATAHEITAMELDTEGQLWVGTKSDGAMLLDGEKLVKAECSFASKSSACGKEDSCARAHVFQFYCHANGRLYCATDIGIVVVEGNQIVDLFSNLTTGLPVSRIMRIDAFTDGKLICGSYSGVLFVDALTGNLDGRLGIKDGLPNGFAATVKMGLDGTLWIGTSEGLYQYQSEGAETENGKSVAKVSPVVDPKFLLKAHIKDIKEVAVPERTVSSGPSNSRRKTHLFVASSQGITKFDPTHGVSQTFFQARDLESVAIGKNSIWIGSVCGLTQCKQTVNRPTLLCDAAEAGLDLVDGRCYASTDQTLSRIKLMAQSPSTNHDEFVFRYRLNKSDEPGYWVTTTTNTIKIPKLSAGEYHLEMVALDRDLRPSNTVRLDYHVSLPLVAWFRQAVAWVTSLACIGFGTFFVVSTIRTKRQLERRVEQRTAEALAAHEETRRLEYSLLHAQKLDSLGVMAAGIAHDFNNSLCAISSNMELALWHLNNQADLVPKYLDASLAATQQASELTQSLLSFAGKLHPKKETTQLQEILEDSLRMIRGVLPASVRIESDFADEPIWCDLDTTQMNQVVVNLAMNSRDAMPNGGRLHLEAFRGPTNAVLRIQDTGHGMDNLTLSRIFEPFFTTKSRGKGTGLGMSMVHSILAAHDGEITVESQVGAGTIVEIRLPTSSHARQKPRETTIAIERQRLAGTVIVADDEVQVRNTLVDVLSEWGLLAIGVEDGRQLIEAAKKHRANLVLIAADVDMPYVDGINAVKTIRETIPNVPAIIFSGQATVLDKFQDSKTAFMQKPFRLNEILEHANRLTQRARSTVA